MLKRLYHLAFLALLWGPPLIRSRFSDRTPNSSMQGEVDGAAMLEVGVWMVVGALVYLMIIGGAVRRRLAFSPTLLRGACGAFFAYVALELVSISYAPGAAYAGFRAIQVSVALLCAAIVTRFDDESEGNHHSLLNLLFFFCTLNVVYTIVTAVVQPDLVFIGKTNQRLIGGYLFRPDYGLASIAVIIWQAPRVVHLMRRWWLSGLIVIAAGTVLIMARTRTTIVAALVALLVILVSRRGRFARGSVLLVVVGLSMAGLFMWESIAGSEQAEYIARTESLSTLSGRLDVWPIMLAQWWDAPFLHKIFGFGYVTGSRVLLVDMYHKGFGNTHNAMLETLMSTGVIGTVVAIMMTIKGANQIGRLVFDKIPQHLVVPAAQAAALLAGTLVAGVAGLSFANMQYIDLMMFIVGIVEGRRILGLIAAEEGEAADSTEEPQSADDEQPARAVPAPPVRVLRAGH